MGLMGHIDRCDEKIEGWIFNPAQPGERVSFDVFLGDLLLASGVADQPRRDLVDAKIGDGSHAFSVAIPAFLPKSQLSDLFLRPKNSQEFIRYDDLAKGVDPSESKKYISKYGGLWIDLRDWIDVLALKFRRNEISDEVSGQIFNFVRDGYVVIKGAVDSALIDALNEEMDGFWANPPPGMLVETFEPDGVMRRVPPELGLRDGRTKLLDVYAFSDLAKQAIAAPKVFEFLKAIFEGPPKAFQSLSFTYGSQQAIHKDTAYVKVDPNPMHLAATWLALEDISPGTGELEYFEGSHRAPDYLFGKISKWMESFTSEHDEFLRSLQNDAVKYEYRKSSFLAKKGDVLIWHADLAHGGSKILAPARTRKSLVTHFTTVADQPFYCRNSRVSSTKVNGCEFISPIP